jgi:RNase P subunit RPR2
MAMTEQEFLTYYSDLCPNCKSPDISAQDYSWVQTDISINVTCDHCGASWRVEGQVTGYDALEIGPRT